MLYLGAIHDATKDCVQAISVVYLSKAGLGRDQTFQNKSRLSRGEFLLSFLWYSYSTVRLIFNCQTASYLAMLAYCSRHSHSRR